MIEQTVTAPSRRQALALLAAAPLWMATLTSLNSPALADDAASGARAPLGVGSRIEPAALKDQHEQTLRLDGAVQLVLFAADMDASKLVRELLGESIPSSLEQGRAVYVADISAMPSMVAGMFAIPKMQKYPFRVALGREESTLAYWPREAGQVSLISLQDGELTAVRFSADAKVIRAALEAVN